MAVESGLFDLCANPEYYAVELHGRVVALGERGVVVRPMNDHVEVDILWDGRRRLVVIPTANSYITQIECAAESVRSLFAAVEVVRGCRVCSVIQRNYSFRVDIMVCDVVAGEAITQPTSELYTLVATLEDRLRHCDCTFDSLSIDDLVIGVDGALYPQRLRTLRLGRGDESYMCCDTMRRSIAAMSGAPLPKGVRICEESHKPQRRDAVEGHIWCGAPHEERIAVLDEEGYGFVDTENRVVVESKYHSVTDFNEGRAVVESRRGYGLIDVWGNYIINDLYEDMAFNPTNGVTVAKLNNAWARFNYCGTQISEFTPEYPAELLDDF